MNPAARKRIDEARRLGPVLRRIGMSCRPQRVRDLGEDAGDQFETLLEHLDDCGLEPVADETERASRSPRARTSSSTVTSGPWRVPSMRGPLRDILAQVPGPLTIDEVEPFLTPDSCELRLLAARTSAQTA
ncbi:hypothetical protein IOD13_11215 [Brevibacterium casei]|nr:hypothetical protein [Brevibacterium casei]